MTKRRLALGVDIGGTKVEMGMVAADGTIVVSERYLVHAELGPDNVIADLIAAAKRCAAQAGQAPVAFGLGVAGQIYRSGKVRFSPNLFWRDVPLQDRLQESMEIPVMVTNDVRAAAFGEWQFGAGRGVEDLICVFVGTGIGGSIISGGRILDGCLNSAGELGHTTVVAGGRRCRCPNRGCLEAYAGGWAIAVRAQEAVRADPNAGQKLTEVAGAIDRITGVTVTEAFRQGDPLAVHLAEETADYLASGITGFVNALNPSLVILGGGVINGMPEYISMVDKRVRAAALPTAVEDMKIVPGLLGGKAAVIGSATLARQKLTDLD